MLLYTYKQTESKGVKTMKKYMVIVAKQDDLNLTILDFDLTKEEAEEKAKNLNCEEWETICICEHSKFEY